MEVAELLSGKHSYTATPGTPLPKPNLLGYARVK